VRLFSFGGYGLALAALALVVLALMTATLKNVMDRYLTAKLIFQLSDDY